MRFIQQIITTFISSLLFSLSAHAVDHVTFQSHSITEDQSTYQVHLIDINQDGKLDIVGTSPNPEEETLYWYENPGWERHVLATDLKPIILWITSANLAGDATPELIALAGFSPNGVQDSSGELYYLESHGDPLNPWKATLIDRQPLSHRGFLADYNGDGEMELAIAPVAGGPADHLNVYSGKTPLLHYELNGWKLDKFTEMQGHIHGMTVVDWDNSGGSDLLTAGLEGIWLHRLQNSRWISEQISAGNASDEPFQRGSSDLRMGKLANGKRFLVASEPWHAGDLYLYLEQEGQWIRQQIEDDLVNAHAIATADLNGDGTDEIVVGNRTGDFGNFIYYADDATGTRWTRTILDADHMGGTDCNSADLNKDGRLDIVCGGHFTNNIRWYENLGVQP